MAGEFTVGDVIRKARMARRWNQTRLGAEAAKYPLRARDVAINKSTVSKVEKDPYTSEFGTVWRLLTALRLTFGDVEKRVGHPVLAHAISTGSAASAHTPKAVVGQSLASTPKGPPAVSHDETGSVPDAASQTKRELGTEVNHAVRETARRLGQSTRAARAAGDYVAAPRRPVSGGRARDRKPRR